ncbi:MAG: SDR family oxidoreductase [Gammaproteobacteria bacterium]|nr:SDR family oxidoreductase [Gammaproteobacteria bacterium]
MRKNKSILITGCSSGIGYHVAHGLKARGYQVIASCRKPEDVKRLQQEGLDCVLLDLDDTESIGQGLQECLKICDGHLDALFNNGAFGLPGAVEDLSRDAIRAQFETNLFGWLELTNLVLPIMREAGAGRIIQNSSVLGFVSLPYRGAYVASKFALEGLTDTLRLELSDTDIKVVLIEPGPIESRFRQNAERAFHRFINTEKSAHQSRYEAMEQRLQKKGHATAFTLPADAVLEKVIDALESARPKIRYYVTFPTYLFGYLKRILSSRLIDHLMLKVSGDGKR